LDRQTFSFAALSEATAQAEDFATGILTHHGNTIYK
jgi:hypothetical protein